jgi:hypothetical protein
METLKARRAWSEIFQVMNENNFNPTILYPAKLSFKTGGAIKIFHDKQKLKQYMTTKMDKQYQTTGDEKTQNQRVTLIQMHTIKPLNNKYNKMAGIITYPSILTLNVSKLNSPIKRHHLANWIKKEDPTIYCLQETHLTDRKKKKTLA